MKGKVCNQIFQGFFVPNFSKVITDHIIKQFSFRMREERNASIDIIDSVLFEVSFCL